MSTSIIETQEMEQTWQDLSVLFNVGNDWKLNAPIVASF